MNLEPWKKKLSEQAARVLANERAQQFLADERVQRAVSTAFEVGQQAKQEFGELRTQVEQLIAARNAGPAEDDTQAMKDELDRRRDDGA